jgi:Ethanolamine utilization protein EutJ (predicted chaperonin)
VLISFFSLDYTPDRSREYEWYVNTPQPSARYADKNLVVGVDFGTLNTVIAVARNRGVDVVCGYHS